MEFGPIVI